MKLWKTITIVEIGKEHACILTKFLNPINRTLLYKNIAMLATKLLKVKHKISNTCSRTSNFCYKVHAVYSMWIFQIEAVSLINIFSVSIYIEFALFQFFSHRNFFSSADTKVRKIRSYGEWWSLTFFAQSFFLVNS